MDQDFYVPKQLGPQVNEWKNLTQSHKIQHYKEKPYYEKPRKEKKKERKINILW